MECSGHIRDGVGSFIDEGLGCLSKWERDRANEIAGGGTMGRGRGLLEGRLETIREGRRLIEEGLHGAYRRRGGEFFREGMSCY